MKKTIALFSLLMITVVTQKLQSHELELFSEKFQTFDEIIEIPGSDLYIHPNQKNGLNVIYVQKSTQEVEVFETTTKNSKTIFIAKKLLEYNKKVGVDFIRKLLQLEKPDKNDLIYIRKDRDYINKLIPCAYCPLIATDFTCLWYHFQTEHSKFLDREAFNNALKDPQYLKQLNEEDN